VFNDQTWVGNLDFGYECSSPKKRFFLGQLDRATEPDSSFSMVSGFRISWTIHKEAYTVYKRLLRSLGIEPPT
jgi:hypothetical protein